MQKVIISGYYLSNGQRVDYNGVEVVIPDCPETLLISNLINRVVPRFFSTADKPYSANGKCFIDKVKKDTKTKPSYAGKSLKNLEWNEIQDLAIALNLNEVPLFRACSVREARQKTYRAFCNKVMGKELSQSFDFVNAEDFLLEEDKKSSNATSSDDEDNLL